MNFYMHHSFDISSVGPLGPLLSPRKFSGTISPPSSSVSLDSSLSLDSSSCHGTYRCGVQFSYTLQRSNMTMEKRIIYQVLPSDPFGGVKWPFQWLSGLHLGDQRVTWKKLVYHLKMYLLLKMVIFHCHFNFLEGKFSSESSTMTGP